MIIKFDTTVTKVEERFERLYNGDKIGEAKVESQMEWKNVSTGWWMVIGGVGLAIGVGKDKPDINVGEQIEISIKRKPK